MGTAFFHRSELDLSALSHFSAGGQLLHPSEVKSSMSELCVSPLSNVVAGIGDAGNSIRAITRASAPSKFDFFKVNPTSAGINDLSYKPAQAVAIISGSARRAPIRSSK